MLPNFIIAGAPKAGTSSLHSWIADHPDALGSIEKETYYFVDPGTHMYRKNSNIQNGLTGYEEFFAHEVGSRHPLVILESTPAYIYYESALKHIPGLSTEPKCLFVLREPSSQIFSLFQYFQNNWSWIPSDYSFEQYIEGIRSGTARFRGNELAENALAYGRYVDFLLNWRVELSAERMMVCSVDDLLADQKEFTKRVASWVGLDTTFYDSYDFPRENETYQPKSRWLQNLNVSVRGYLPKGHLYDAMRTAYRKLNTSRTSAASARNMEIMAELKKDFAEANRHLSDEFGIDVSNW
jgi:hypothetical protein